MKLVVLPALIVLLGLSRCASEGPVEEPTPDLHGGPTIRILLRKATSRPTVRIVTRTPYEASVPDTGEIYASGPLLDRSQPALGGLLEHPVLIRSEDRVIRIDGVSYAGDLLLEPVETGVQLILRTDLESYLPGVLAGELSAAFPPAALRTQAIASRTYAMHRMRIAPRSRSWDVTDDTGSQVFVGLPGTPDVFSTAVADTRGMVLVWAGHPVPAYFHSTCGGHTAAVTEAFDEPLIPPLVGTRCNFCSRSRFYRWSATIPAAEAASRLSLDGPVTAALRGEPSRSGRTDTLSFRARNVRKLPAAEARMLLGPDRLYSTRITDLSVADGNLLLHGSGWGHGVGLCQMGARGMADGGASAADILGHYYPGAELLRLY